VYKQKICLSTNVRGIFMDNKKPNQKLLIEHLKSILNDLNAGKVDKEVFEGGSFFALADGVISLHREGTVAFRKFLIEAKKDEVIRNKVGDRKLEAALVGLVASLEDASSPQDTQLNELVNELLQSVKSEVQSWTVWVPVDNLKLEGLDELTIGNVTFRSPEVAVARIKSEGATRLAESPNSEPTRRSVTKRLDDFINIGCKGVPDGWCCPDFLIAEAQVEFEKSAVNEVAEFEVEAALDLLRCCAPIIFHSSVIPLIGLRGSVDDGLRVCFAFSDSEWLASGHRFGTTGCYVLTRQQMEQLKSDACFDALSQALRDVHSLEFDSLSRIVGRAVRWVGRGMRESEVPEKVMHFAVALESLLLLQDENRQIRTKFARRLAVLLSSEPETQCNISTRLKELYTTRCKVVHDGITDVPASEVDHLEYFARKALIKIAGHLHEWKTHKEFVEWAKHQQCADGPVL
jgi:hypothetical protein